MNYSFRGKGFTVDALEAGRSPASLVIEAVSEACPAFLERGIMGGLASLWPTFLGGFHGTLMERLRLVSFLFHTISFLPSAVAFAVAAVL